MTCVPPRPALLTQAGTAVGEFVVLTGGTIRASAARGMLHLRFSLLFALTVGCSSTEVVPECSGRFVSAGFLSLHTTRPDGTSTVVDSPLRDAYYDGLALGEDRIVALGDDGRVALSDDLGETFVAGPSSSGLESFELVYRAGRFVAAGRDLSSTRDEPQALVVSSVDGEEWAALGEPVAGGFFEALDASETAVLAVGGGKGALAGRLHRFTEEGGWLPVSAEDGPQYRDVFYDGAAFYAIASSDPSTGQGAIARSIDDGLTFEVWSVEPGLLSLTKDSGRWLASGERKVAVSVDAITWTVSELEPGSDRPEDQDSWYFYKVAYDGCEFVAVGGIMGWTAKSKDGVTWSAALGPSHGNLLEVINVP